jgi:hypothetical protein
MKFTLKDRKRLEGFGYIARSDGLEDRRTARFVSASADARRTQKPALDLLIGLDVFRQAKSIIVEGDR